MSSFDKSVISISQEERMELYDKLRASMSPSDQVIEDTPVPKEFSSNGDRMEQLKSESIFCRIVLFFKSLFSGVDTEYVYTETLIKRLAKYIERKYPGLINYKKGLLCTPFHTQLRELKSVAEYFTPGIDLYEESPGAFYVFLSSLIMPEFYVKLEREIDPFGLPKEKQPVPEVRNALLRRMDEIFQEFTSKERNLLYTAVSNIDWLRQFVRLPYDKFFLRFVPLSNVEYNAQIELIGGELSAFCRVLCNGKSVSADVLQALFLFSMKTQLSNADLDIESLSEEYVKKSVAQIRVIKRFLADVPLHSLAAVAMKNPAWQPPQPEGAEDWFVKYKSEWRKMFDSRWNDWCKSCSKQVVAKKVYDMLGQNDLPELPHRPWAAADWINVKYARELSAGFLYAFFGKGYPSINKPLKILMVDGDFKVRDNRIEFTDAYNEMGHIASAVDVFVNKFAKDGDYGQFFASAIEKDDRSVKVHQRFESTMTAAVSEADNLSLRFRNCATLLANILTGIVSEDRVGKYDTLSNISVIEGHQNQQYRQRLVEVRDILLDAVTCSKELDGLGG